MAEETDAILGDADELALTGSAPEPGRSAKGLDEAHALEGISLLLLVLATIGWAIELLSVNEG